MNPKILILSIFPAPYRVSIFKGLAAFFDVTCFFETTKNESRSKEWFEKSDEFPFYLLNTEEGKKIYTDTLKNITNYDLVVAYDFTTKNALKLELLCILKQVPYIINCDGATVINKSFCKKIIKSFFVKHAVKCFAGCQRAKEYFLAYGAKNTDVIVHNFTSLFRNEILKRKLNVEEKNKIRNELGLPIDKLLVLSVGQFIHRKGFDVLIKSWGKIDSSNSKLLIIGGGPEKDNYKRLILSENINNLDLIDFVQPSLVMKYMQAADLFVLPTRTDIWGLVINEAMASGLPVITTNECTAGTELVENGVNGYIVEVDNVNELAIYLNQVLHDSDWLKKAGEYSLIKIKDYNFESIIESHVNVINKVLK